MRRWHHSAGAMIVLILVASGVTLIAAEAWAGRGSLEAGLRAGASFNEEDESFNQYDMYVQYGLPWSWVWGDALQVDTNVATAIGVLEGGAMPVWSVRWDLNSFSAVPVANALSRSGRGRP